ncbi:MAG TPA: TolC family protein [Pyrinomonadaceae bacterium]|nr:TolC family protein [Chloracidobacterium sp.]MBP9109318.1 TolC family protein [Pyrinomonadaceae bacterium]MBK7801246.1 TolC family protein [Chloracidobacterium sp.]MBK9436569.1 TolC family protein [Chloracidobacterium sp.]MBL0241553.1 TolC family protein [Chloracidobacterium sp.]
MKRHLYIIWLVMLLAFGTAARAQQPTPTPTPSDTQTVAPENLQGVPAIAPNYRSDDRSLPDLGRVGVDMTRQKSLTLRETIELALSNNRDIEVSRKTARMAEFDLQSTRGFFQPRLSGQTYYDHTTTPNVSIFSNNQKATQGTLLGNAALQAFAPQYGTIFTGAFNNTRVTTDNPISILSPQYNSTLSFAVTQPLFRGRKIDAARRTIEIFKKNLSLTDTQFRQRSIEIVAGAEKAYWDLAFALRNLQVQRDSVRDAKSQLEHSRRLAEEGQLAPIDVVASETQVANFEQAVYDALNVVNLTENALKNLISANRSDVIWSEALTPVDPVELDTPRTTLTEAMDAALSNRPELELNRAQRDINAIDQRLYRDQQKPQIDFIASYSSSGVGGTQNPDFSPSFPTPCTTAPTSPACAQQQANLALLTGNPLSGIFANRYPTFRFGVQFNLPLFGDKTAGALLGKSKVEAERIDTQREQIEQGVQVEVRNALQAIRTNEARLRAAAVARDNSAKQYDSEQRKLDAGQSDIYKVLERQTALAVARSNELRARTELNKAIAELERATGNSLKAKNIEPK